MFQLSLTLYFFQNLFRRYIFRLILSICFYVNNSLTFLESVFSNLWSWILKIRQLCMPVDSEYTFLELSNMIFNKTEPCMIKHHYHFFSKPLQKTIPFSIKIFTPNLHSCVSSHQKEQKKLKFKVKIIYFIPHCSH